jgi:hypothetical protein
VPRPMERLYGGGPLHLALMLGALALAGYAVLELGLDNLFDPDSWWQSIAVWFVAAAVVHDVVLFPAYSFVDRVLSGPRKPPQPQEGVRLLNYVRVPLMAAGLTFLVFLPGIIQQGSDAHLRATGLTQAPYLERWLLLTAAFFVASAVLYVVRSRTVRRKPS